MDISFTVPDYHFQQGALSFIEGCAYNSMPTLVTMFRDHLQRY